MVDYSEKRDFQRMTLDCSLDYQKYGEDRVYQGQVKNLSATGILFITKDSIPLGVNIQIKLTPVNTITPPMSADVKISRCDKHSDGEYHVAGVITQVD